MKGSCVAVLVYLGKQDAGAWIEVDRPGEPAGEVDVATAIQGEALPFGSAANNRRV